MPEKGGSMSQGEHRRTIEKLYWDLIGNMGPTERIAKAARMITSVRKMVETQIRERNPAMDEQTLKFAVAHRVYWNEPKVLHLLTNSKNEKMMFSMSDPLMQDLNITTKKIVTILEKLERPFAFTEGLACIAYGDPRTTNDVDLILEIDPREYDLAQTFAKMLEDDFFFSVESCREAIEEQTMFQAIDKETMFKIDFHLSNIVPGSCERRRQTKIPTGLVIPIVTPEDAILSKLVWIKLGSDRSRKDVIAMLRVQKELDNEYLERTAEQLDVAEILKELRKIADDCDPNIIL